MNMYVSTWEVGIAVVGVYSCECWLKKFESH